MGLFKKKKEILDLTERYKKQQEKIAEMKADSQEQNSESSKTAPSPFNIFGMPSANSSSQETSSEPASFSSSEDKRRKLSKRLKDMTDKLEDVSNQIYHLQQRIEVLERKADVGRY